METIDLTSSKKWKRFDIPPNDSDLNGNPKATPISHDEIIIFCGQGTTEALIYA